MAPLTAFACAVGTPIMIASHGAASRFSRACFWAAVSFRFFGFFRGFADMDAARLNSKTQTVSRPITNVALDLFPSIGNLLDVKTRFLRHPVGARYYVRHYFQSMTYSALRHVLEPS